MTIEELKQALEAATPGKWEQNGIAIGIGCHQEICLMAWPSNHPGDISEPFKNSKANAHLIVAAVNNLPKLLKVAEEREALQARCDKLEAAARDLLDNAEPKWGDKVVVHRSVIEALRSVVDGGE